MLTDTDRRLRIPALIAASAAALAGVLALTAGTATAAKPPASFYGVSPQTSLAPEDFERMGRGNLGTLRIPIFWTVVDRFPPAGDYDFSTIDPIFAEAARNDIEVLPFLFGTPTWLARSADNRNCQDCSKFAPVSREALSAWADYVGAVVERYGRNGTFWAENPTIPARPVRAWQIWNEQNSRSFYAPRNKPELYAKLLDRAQRAVKAEDRKAEIVLGGMPELAGSKKATAGSKYLAKLYRVPGVERDFGGIGLHPYGASLRKVTDQVELFREVIVDAGDPQADIWVTEIGAGSATGGNPLNRGRQGQAALLKQTYNYFKEERNRLNIRTVVWFSFVDSMVSICDWCPTSGLFEQGLVAKPSWRAFVRFTGGR